MKENDYILAVYEEKSFSKAAKRLFLSQPALSMAVKRVEDELGITIFDRSSLRLQLTDEGRIYIEALEEIRTLRQSIEAMKDKLFSGEVDRYLFAAKDIRGLKVVTISNSQMEAADLRKMGDFIKDRYPNAVAVLASAQGDKATLLAVCGKNAIARGIRAGDLIRKVTAVCGGSGGGKPDSAMGGCKNVLKLDDALAVVDDLVNDTAKD